MLIKGRTHYYPVLQIPTGESGTTRVEHIEREANHPFQLSSPRAAILGGQRGGKLSYPFPTTWHRLVDENGVWMSDFPIEQRQHDEELKGMRGTVLVGGLGLGYAVTALAAKAAVKRIVVIEKSPDVVRLVWENLGDLGSKAECVVTDLFHFLEDNHEHFNYGFYDIWRSDSEYTFHNIVVPLRQLSHTLVRHVRCWNEDVMRGQLLLGLTSIFAMLKFDDIRPANYITLEQLCEGDPSGPAPYFRNWFVPFWRWVAKHDPSQGEFESAAYQYASYYGIPELAYRLEDKFGEVKVWLPTE